MEKTMSVEERIRRAEERYNSKNNNQNSFNKDKKKNNIKKMFMQMFICLLIYILFYVATNSEYIFSESFKQDVGIFFTEKINEKYLGVKSYIERRLLNNNENIENENHDAKIDEDIENSENEQKNEKIENQEEDNNLEGDGLGGAKEEENDKKENNEMTQMEKDAEKIKSCISFIKPIEGKVTSKFGWRNPTNKKIPKNHTGIDIGAEQGTKIKSATDGKVILVSSKGDYGNHYKIKINDVIIIYAHCKKLYLNEGDTVKQGQEIAEVGSTGNSTGPHLHFEIRMEDRKIDPQLILEF